MKRRFFITSMVIAYAGLMIIIFAGIKNFEIHAREWYYNTVTRRMVSNVSRLPVNRRVLGVYRPEIPYSFSKAYEIEQDIGMRFTLFSIYQAWGDNNEHLFPSALMNAIVANGGVPVLTWEPWVNKFNNPDLRPMPRREQRYLLDIAEGVYDEFIVQWAREAVTWGKPFFLRFAHEMSNPQYPWTPKNNNSPEEYIQAWWHIRELFDSLGADNIIWVWSPYKVGDIKYYPGDKYVDWVALDIFNFGELISGGGQRWFSFDQMLDPIYTELEEIRKPFMIAEVGSTDRGGNRGVWYREMFSQIFSKYDKVKAVILFDNPSDRTSGRWTIDWSVGEDHTVIDEIKTSLENSEFTYVKDYSDRLMSTEEGGLK